MWKICHDDLLNLAYWQTIALCNDRNKMGLKFTLKLTCSTTVLVLFEV